jgi:hypothetical protein
MKDSVKMQSHSAGETVSRETVCDKHTTPTHTKVYPSSGMTEKSKNECDGSESRKLKIQSSGKKTDRN